MSESNMSPKELLFKKFFSEEKILVLDMDDAALMAHIQELQQIAFEARARLTASDDEARERSAKKKAAKGFSANVNVADDFTSNAINNINERQKKMSKQEKEIERLVSLGIDRKDAENMYKASTVNTIKKQGVQAVIDDNAVVKDIINSIVNAAEDKKCPECGFQFDTKNKGIKECPECKSSVNIPKAFNNPFAPKVVEQTQEFKDKAVEVVTQTAIEEVIKVKEEQQVTPKFINPFAKKD